MLMVFPAEAWMLMVFPAEVWMLMVFDAFSAQKWRICLRLNLHAFIGAMHLPR